LFYPCSSAFICGQNALAHRDWVKVGLASVKNSDALGLVTPSSSLVSNRSGRNCGCAIPHPL